jgi:hypothetical protein
MSDVIERIAGWQDAGLIDVATADRLRAAEAARDPDTSPTVVERAAPARASEAGRARGPGSFFGPTPTITEMFVYLGGAFFIAAYSAFLARIAGTANRDAIMTAGSLLGTGVLVALGLWLAGGDARRRRAGGVLLLVAVNAAAVTAGFLFQLLGWSSGSVMTAVIALVALVVAIFARRMVPAVTTQVGLLGGVTVFGATLMAVIRDLLDGTINGVPTTGAIESFQPRIGDVGRDVLLPALGWGAIAVIVGLIGLAEGRSGRAAAQHRAGITRLWAGLVAVGGVAAAVTTTGFRGADDYGRVLEPWIADLVILAVAAVIVERAFRRDAAAFVIPAAIGLVTALTDFNFSYLADSTDVGLVSEGVILLGVGYAADRLRRRLGRDDGGASSDRAAPMTDDPLTA